MARERHTFWAKPRPEPRVSVSPGELHADYELVKALTFQLPAEMDRWYLARGGTQALRQGGHLQLTGQSFGLRSCGCRDSSARCAVIRRLQTVSNIIIGIQTGR